MLEGYELIQSRETPSVSFCEYELEEPSTCGDAWERTLDAFAIPQSKARQELRESLVEKTCDRTSNHHSSQSVTEGNYKPPSHEMVAMLVELDKTLLNGRIAALNASMDCPLSARYRAP